MQPFMIYFTIDNYTNAENLVTKLVRDDIVSCANIINNAKSIYKWKDEIITEEETLVIAKTICSPKSVIEVIKKLHPYDIPCIVSYKISNIDEDYIKWMRNN